MLKFLTSPFPQCICSGADIICSAVNPQFWAPCEYSEGCLGSNASILLVLQRRFWSVRFKTTVKLEVVKDWERRLPAQLVRLVFNAGLDTGVHVLSGFSISKQIRKPLRQMRFYIILVLQVRNREEGD